MTTTLVPSAPTPRPAPAAGPATGRPAPARPPAARPLAPPVGRGRGVRLLRLPPSEPAPTGSAGALAAAGAAVRTAGPTPSRAHPARATQALLPVEPAGGRAGGHRPRTGTSVPARAPACSRGSWDPELPAVTRSLVLAVLEVAAGALPPSRLVRVVSPEVLAAVERWARGARRRAARPPVVRSVRATQPAPGVAEVCAVVVAGARVRAVAARLEHDGARWRCTAFELG